MSLPSFPDVHKDLTFENSINQILTSISMEEIGLSHIINAEGEKLQYVLGTLPGAKPLNPTIDEILKINQSIQETMKRYSISQLFLNEKMSEALKGLLHYIELVKDSHDGNSNHSGDDSVSYIQLLNGTGPYESRVVAGDWTHTFTLRANVSVPYGEEAQIEVLENGSIKLEDIIVGDDFSGFTVSAADSALSQYFWIDKDKAGNYAIIYNYVPDIDVWDAEAPNLPLVNVTLILSKQGYDDTEIVVNLRYDGSLFSRG